MEARPATVTSSNYDYSAKNSNAVKSATPDILILQEGTLSAEVMTDLIFENIGGQEIISISRNDIVNGQNVVYQPIKNITSLYYQYNPQNILSLQKTDKEYFKNFSINLGIHLPECGTGTDPETGDSNCKYVYIDQETGDLVVELINMTNGEEVEVQVISNVSVLDDTIY